MDTTRSADPDREWRELSVDVEGNWFHRGSRITRPEILEALCASVDLARDGRFVLAGEKGRYVIDVADTVFVVASVDFLRSQTGEERIQLRLKHVPGPEVLDPATLEVGRDNVLYCRIRGARFSARFSRPAYYQLARFIEEDADGTGFHIELNGTVFSISYREPARQEQDSPQRR
jgi:uncharacterized protein